jgi:multiple sugar transport system substrate-binding protein
MDSVQLPQYADKGLFQPLDDLYDSGAVEKDKLVSSAVEAGKWNDKYYGVPMNFTTLLLYWNKDMFQKAGITSAPKTWADWQSDAQKLTKDSNGDGKPEQYGLALADHETIAMWPILIWGNGGDVVTPEGKVMLDDPKTVDAVSQWANLVRTKHISPVGLAGADADKLFQSKKAAMEVVGPWMTSGFKSAGIDFGLAMVPKGPAKQVTLGTSVMFALSAKVDDDTKKAAEQFIAFWEKKPSQITWATGSGFPPDRTDITASELTGNPYVAQFGKYADKSQFYLAGVKPVTQVDTDTFQPAIQKIENGSPAQQQLKNAADKIDSILSSSQ